MTLATKEDTPVFEVIREIVDNATTGKVFGEPITDNGITVLPVAKVSGGGGGGSGTGLEQDGHETGGTGGGVGVAAKPLGVFVIKDGDVKWRPAIDINRVILGAQAVAVVALLVVRTLIKSRRNHS